MDTRHQSYSRIVPDSRTAVLFIHGICGSPSFFEDFYPRVPADWSIRSPLLAGHGGNSLDFARSSMKAWKDQVKDEIEALARSHDSVILTGHSLGSLLSIGQSLETEAAKGLFLIAVPLKLHPHPAAMIHSVRTALGMYPGGKPELEEALRLYSIEPDLRVWRYLGFIPRYYELLQEMKVIRSRISEISLPCRAVFSRHDEIVSPRSAGFLEENSNIQVSWLENSDHNYHPFGDKEILLSDFEAFCRSMK